MSFSSFHHWAESSFHRSFGDGLRDQVARASQFVAKGLDERTSFAACTCRGPAQVHLCASVNVCLCVCVHYLPRPVCPQWVSFLVASFVEFWPVFRCCCLTRIRDLKGNQWKKEKVYPVHTNTRTFLRRSSVRKTLCTFSSRKGRKYYLKCKASPSPRSPGSKNSLVWHLYSLDCAQIRPRVRGWSAVVLGCPSLLGPGSLLRNAQYKVHSTKCTEYEAQYTTMSIVQYPMCIVRWKIARNKRRRVNLSTRALSPCQWLSLDTQIVTRMLTRILESLEYSRHEKEEKRGGKIDLRRDELEFALAPPHSVQAWTSHCKSLLLLTSVHQYSRLFYTIHCNPLCCWCSYFLSFHGRISLHGEL